MNYYLQNYAFRDQLIDQPCSAELGLIVVIPCCNEHGLIDSLKSLESCERPAGDVEVIVVVNAAENAPDELVQQNLKTCDEFKTWNQSLNLDWLSFHLILEHDLPAKHAGVGLARKIGMDEAVRRFETINTDGVIACFDADANCESSYLIELERHFKDHPKSPACSVHFEHPISGEDFPESIYKGIIQYELHLRYYKNGLAYAGLPYAFHTIGSSMAVKSSAYQKQNGMNKRKAGEDFYFLQKLIPLGGFTELKSTKVIPSPRVSDRVPFGTGRAMQEWVADEPEELETYNFKSFQDLAQLNEKVADLYYNKKEDIPTSVNQFLASIGFDDQLLKISSNSRSEEHFKELFYKWFNAFRVLKFMHFARDHHYPNQLISDASSSLLNNLKDNKIESFERLLSAYRALDLE